MEDKFDVAIIGTRGWISPEDSDFVEEKDRTIFERERLRLQMSFASLNNSNYKKLICVMHFPPYGFQDLLETYRVDHCVYGHLHGENAFSNG